MIFNTPHVILFKYERLSGFKIKIKGGIEMRIEDLDISKLSEEEFNKKIGNALADIHKLVERGIEERGFVMNLFAITSILVEDEEAVYNIDNSIMNEGMAEHIALTSESIGEIIETFSIRKLFTEFGVEDDE